MSGLPANWKNWVLNQLLSGQPAMQILQVLLDKGFTFEQSKAALGSNLPKGLNSKHNAAFFARLAKPKLLQDLAKHNAEYLEQEKVQLLCLRNFLTADECQHIITLAKTRLRPSTIAATSGFEGFRTSSTCDLPYLNAPAADAVDKKIIDCLGLGVGENEVIQAQHYALDQQFKAHTDYFEPATDEYHTYARVRGQRTWTFMVYLNQECEGGETEFTNLGLSVKPQTGMALVWNNLYADGRPNPDTIHQAHPVTKGEKVVITKWFRDRQQ